jgi:hypothetical protein
MRRETVATLIGGVIYVLVAILLVGWLVQVRTWSLRNQDTPEARAEWQRWRQEAAEPATREGSVERRVPKSAEPPLLLMMREYFAMSIAATLFFWTALFVPLLLMLRGVLAQGRNHPRGSDGSTKAA